MKRWMFAARQGGAEFEAGLSLHWEINGESMSDDYLPEEISAATLWDLWIAKWGQEVMPICWSVQSEDPGGHSEFAPPSLQPQTKSIDREDFLAYYTVPTDIETGAEVRWSALPVVDKLWRPARADKGGFIQEATGWKPSPLQSHADIKLLADAAGLTKPRGMPAD